MSLPSRFARSSFEGHAFAVIATLAMLLMRYAINGLIGESLPLMTGLLAVIVSAWYGGTWPGLLAMMLSALVGVAMFRVGGWANLDAGTALLLCGFLWIGTVTSLLFGALRRAHTRIDADQDDVRRARGERARSQQVARDAELRHRLVIEASFDALYEWSVETNRTVWNEGLSTLFGYADRVIEDAFVWWREHIHPADLELTLEGFRAVQKSRSAKWSAEYRVRCADGRYIWVLDRAGMVYDAGGRMIRIIGAMQDMSERQRTAETLAHFKALFEVQPSSILVCEAGPDFIIATASDAYLRATHTRRADIVGRPLFEAFPDDSDAQGIGPIRAAFNKVLATGEPEQLPVLPYAVPCANGGLEKHWWSTYHFAVRGPRGELAYIVQRADNVTQYVGDDPQSAAGFSVEPFASVAAQEARNLEQAHQLIEANRRLGERNATLAFFAELSEATRPLLDPNAIVAVIAEKLGRHLAVNRCAWVEFSDDGTHFEVLGDYTDGLYSIRGRHSLADFAAPGPLLTAPTYVLNDVETGPDAQAFRSGYRRIGARAAISVALQKDGRAVAGMAVHHARPREWTREEVELVQQVAERCWETLARVRALRAVSTSEQRLRGLMDAMPAKIASLTADGRIDYLHGPWMDYSGLSFDELSAPEGLAQLLLPEDVQPYREHRQASMQAGEHFVREVRVRRHDGAYRWHQVRHSPVRDAAGRVQSWVSVVTDVHEIKQAEEALRDADRAKDEFLATLAHELRNPIAPIANGLELLIRAGDDSSVRERTLGLMSRQLSQMVRLVDDLLDISRITTGKLVLRRENVALAEIVRNAVESVDPLVRAGGHRVEVELPQHAVTLDCDAARLAQVLSNLLTNSVKYSDQPGTIHLRAAREGDELLRIEVQDQGIGILPEVLPRVFEMFAQSERALSRAQGGLGIGLSLVRRLVELHGGTVEGASEGAGRGSTFTLRLPLLHASAPTPGIALNGTEPVSESAAAPGKRKVLVADDNIDSAESLAALLRMWGHEVVVAHDGEDALHHASDFRPEVMVLDLGMPRRDGVETAREIRTQPWGRGVTLIALSGWGQPADRDMTRAAGFDHHLVKPVDAAKLEKLLLP